MVPRPGVKRRGTMTEDISFSDLLETKASEHKRPPTLPQGIYVFRVGGHKFDKSTRKQTPYVRYTMKLLDVGEDVDVSELDGVDWQGREYPADFYLTGKAAYRLTEFLKKCGVDVEERTFAEVIPEATGCEVKAHLRQRPSNDPGSSDTFNEVGAFYPI